MPIASDFLLYATEVDVERVKRGEKRAERGALSQDREGVHVLREALTAVAEPAIGTWNEGVRIVDVAREKHALMDSRPVRAHPLAVVVDRVEVGHLVRAKDVVRVLRDLRFKRRHCRERLPLEDARQKLHGPREHHRLLAEVLNVRPLRQELRHEADLMPRLLREPVRRSRQDRRSHEHRYIREFANQLLHERQVLRPVILRRHMDLQERDVDLREIVIVPLRRIRDIHLALLRVVFLNPGLERPAHKPTADDANFDLLTHKSSSVLHR